MKIQGLQKMTLLDYPGKVACTVFLGGCDMRCPFCHNSELIDGSAPAVMEDEELLKFLRSRQGILEGVAFTGGEPNLRPDLPDLIRKIKELGYPVKLDSNGTHPERLKKLFDEGLVDYIAMDVKNDEERYGLTCGRENFDVGPIKESINLIKEYGRGKLDYEFRTTVVDQLHDESSFRGIGEMINGAEKYFLQAFTDRDSVVFSGFSAPGTDKMKLYRDIASGFARKCELRGVE